MKTKLLFILGFALFTSCVTCSRKKDDVKDMQTGSDKTAVVGLPYSLQLSSEHTTVITDTVQNKSLDGLFSSGTLQNYPFMYSDHPNHIKGKLLRKLPNKGVNTVLLFAYTNDTWQDAESTKTSTVELQVFTPDNKLIDKLIVADGVEGDCSWYRSFAIDNEYIISLYNRFECIDFNKETKQRAITMEEEVTRRFMLLESGQIVEYFDQAEGEIEKIIEFGKWYMKGRISNHMKTGAWIEYDYVQDPKAGLIGSYVLNNYQYGIKVAAPQRLKDTSITDVKVK